MLDLLKGLCDMTHIFLVLLLELIKSTLSI